MARYDIPVALAREIEEQKEDTETVHDYLLVAVKSGLELDNTREVASWYENNEDA